MQIRVGLNSGEVVVGSIGSDLRMDYTAVGQTTHLAARMEQSPRPASIRSPPRRAAGRRLHRVKPLGSMPVKGLAEPVEVFELIGAGAGALATAGAARRGDSRRFVGRDAEIEPAPARAARRPARGKARSSRWWASRAWASRACSSNSRDRTMSTTGWSSRRSVSYGKATPYLPVIDLLKAYFRIEMRDDARASPRRR